jgi:bifunctional non-homologous end joining protein LigD
MGRSANKDGDALALYKAKRDFSKTAEPAGSRHPSQGRSFVVQRHWARRAHFDFRLEINGVLKSWAVTKGPSARPAAKRLAVRTEDHPLEYASFEGVIPQGEYGGGDVQVWDRGFYEPLAPNPEKALAEGHLKVRLHGERMKGAWALMRMKPRNGEASENWLLVKDRDSFAEDDDSLAERYAGSVASGRTRSEIAAGAKPVARQRQNAPLAFVPPALCDMRKSAPEGEQWLHEMKYDGYRLQIIVDGGHARLFTREGHDWSDRFGLLRACAEKLPVQSAIIDGEAIVFDGNGLSDFPALVAALKGTRKGISLAAFDLLHLDGQDLRKLPLVARKARLKKVLGRKAGPIVYAHHVQGCGPDFFRKAKAGGAEGIVSKRKDQPYRSGRTPAWVKVKDRRRQDVTIIGWTPSDRGRTFAALVVAREETGRLIYAGRVGTGFDATTQASLMALLKPLARSGPPDVERLALAPRGVRWVEPGLIVEIAMAGWTGDGQVRQGAFLGVREDRTNELGAARKRAQAKARKLKPVAPDLSRLTNPDRIMYPEIGITKKDIANYYAKMAPRLMPHLDRRPVSFVRAPEGLSGEQFFQRHLLRGMSRGLAPVSISGEHGDYITIDSPEGLQTCAQFGVLEIHIWGARMEAIEKPDRIVFDLDPDEALPFSDVRKGAKDLRDLLAAAGLESFAMLSGGKGVHVIAPIRPEREWPQIEAFAQGFARNLVREQPQRWTAVMTKTRRKGKIFLDYLRNKRTATAIAPWSLRARANASVAMPISWGELERTTRADAFTMVDALKRRGDPWKHFFTLDQSLSDSTLALVCGLRR